MSFLSLAIDKIIRAVDPKTTLQIGDSALVFDAVLLEKVQQTYQHSTYPSQVGDYSDNTGYRLPLQLQLTVAHGDQISSTNDFILSNLSALAATSGLITQETLRQGLVFFNASKDIGKLDNLSQSTRSSRAVVNLLNMAKGLVTFKLQTAKATYKNMAISYVSYENAAENNGAINIDIGFVELQQYSEPNGYDPSQMLSNSITQLRMQDIKKAGKYVFNRIRSLL